MLGVGRKKKTQHVDLGKAGSFTTHPGKLHRALGIPQDEKIGQKRINKALHSNSEEIRDMARSAKGLTHMR